MFGSLGFTEIAFILILALLLFGPKRLPEIGKTLGKGLAEFRRASNELKRTLESEVAEDERASKRPAAPLAVAASPSQPTAVTPSDSVEASEAPAATTPEAVVAATPTAVETGTGSVPGAEPR